MIPAAFEYERAESVDEALELLADHRGDAKILAGGHSLLPLMKLRLARPERLIDIGRLEELRGVTEGTAGSGALAGGAAPAGALRIGALTTYAELLEDERIARFGPSQTRCRGSATCRYATVGRSAEASPTPIPRRISPPCSWRWTPSSSPDRRHAANGRSRSAPSSKARSRRRWPRTSCCSLSCSRRLPAPSRPPTRRWTSRRPAIRSRRGRGRRRAHAHRGDGRGRPRLPSDEGGSGARRGGEGRHERARSTPSKRRLPS